MTMPFSLNRSSRNCPSCNAKSVARHSVLVADCGPKSANLVAPQKYDTVFALRNILAFAASPEPSKNKPMVSPFEKSYGSPHLLIFKFLISKTIFSAFFNWF